VALWVRISASAYCNVETGATLSPAAVGDGTYQIGFRINPIGSVIKLTADTYADSDAALVAIQRLVNGSDIADLTA